MDKHYNWYLLITSSISCSYQFTSLTFILKFDERMPQHSRGHNFAKKISPCTTHKNRGLKELIREKIDMKRIESN